MKNNLKIKAFKIYAVIFDMDGLMLDTEPLARRAWEIAMSEEGYSISTRLYLKILGRNTQDTKMIFREALGDSLPIDAIFKRKRFIMDEIINTEEIPIKPGLLELIEDINQRHLSKAVASSTDRQTVIKKLSVTGFLNKFDVIVCGDDVQRGKPAPDIFLAAARQLGVEPIHCLVLEDSESGIQAAHTANMHPVMIPDLKKASQDIKKIAIVLRSLYEVKDLLKELD